MDSKELRGLMEAYTEVYAPQEVDEAVKGESGERRRGLAAERKAGIKPLSAKEGEKYADYKMSQMAHSKRKRMGEEVEEVDEATAMAKRGYDEAPIRQKIAKSTGGGAAADRATKLENQPTYGDANKAKQRQNLARAQRGDFRKTTSSSPGLHGYGHKSNDPAVKEKQAARGAQRGVLTPAEKKQLNREEVDIFDVVLEFLQVEGYAETLEEAKWLMANVIDEEAIDIILEVLDTPEKANEYAKKNVKSMLGAFAKGVVNKDISQLKTINKRKRGAELGKRKAERKAAEEQNEEYVDEALTGERYRKVMKKPGGTAYSRKVSANPAKRATRGGKGGESDFGAGDRGTGNRAARRAGTYKEYDVNEAQEARNNPEKYEREQSKKYAPVRGERTPMPPRGDKRREDFEKWYAKQMGR
jgi:hypothetical protein